MNSERFEWMDTILTEYREWCEQQAAEEEWAAYAEDMESDPYNDSEWMDRMELELAKV